MTQITNVIGSNPNSGGTALVGNREDLEDVIYRVAAEATPFYSNIGKTPANAVYHEWQTETLDPAVTSNKAIEGNLFTISAGNQSARIGNSCQIFTKTFSVSRTADRIKKAGRTSETNRQKVIKTLSLRRDVEFSSIANIAAVQRTSTVPGVMGGALTFLTTSTSVAAGGSNGGFSASPGPAVATNGTATRTFTEAQVKTVMALAFNAGGKPSQAYMSATDKQVFSSFTGIADIRVEAKGTSMANIVGAADLYVSDFGNLTLIPHPYALSRDCLIIDPDMWAFAELDGINAGEIAETGDGTQYAITYEGTVVCRNEAGSAVVRDLI